MKKKELGGYPAFEMYSGNLLHDKAIALNSGRHCLRYLIEQKQISKIFFPLLLCDTVKSACDSYGVEYEEYPLSKAMRPLFSHSLSESEYFYIVNYYGQLTNQEISSYKERFGNIILDNVQDYFRAPIEGVDTIYSCRKYFGVSDGGFLYSELYFNDTYEPDASGARVTHLVGRFEDDASHHYAEYLQNEALFETAPIRKMSSLTKNILRSINYEQVAKQRIENFYHLHSRLGRINQLELHVNGSFSYPLLVTGGEKLRDALIQKKIYIPIYWKEVLLKASPSSLEYQYAKNLLPLPIHHSYGVDDMDYLCDEIEALL